MKINKSDLSVILSVSLFLALPSAFASIKEVAKVNGQAITEKDIDLALLNLSEMQRESLLKDGKSKAQVVLSLVNREILAQEAEKQRLDQDPEFKNKLAAYRKQLLMNEILEKKLSAELTPAAVKQFYESRKTVFSTDQVRVQHILFEDEGEAKKVLLMAKKPNADFQKLAENYSQDPSAKNNRGDIGYIPRGRMDAEFTDVAFTSAPGQIVGPVHTAFGYHLIKVIDKKYGRILGFDEVELQAKEMLKQELAQKLVLELRQKVKVELMR